MLRAKSDESRENTCIIKTLPKIGVDSMDDLQLPKEGREKEKKKKKNPQNWKNCKT